MDKRLLKYWLTTNLNLIRSLRFGELFVITSRTPNYWKIRSSKYSLTGYNFRRLSRYREGITEELTTLARYYGVGIEYDIRAKDVIVDIGANIGEFSVFCLKKGATVLPVEPDPALSPCTRENTERFKNAYPVNKLGIWKENGTIHFYHAPSTADSSFIEPDRYDQTSEIPAVTLDKLYELNGLKKVDLLKCDAEGAEPEVLAVAANALSVTKRVAFNCGPERHGQDTVAEVVSCLETYGFETNVIDGYKPKTVVVGTNRKIV
jgi:FkbM family methyltransferase